MSKTKLLFGLLVVVGAAYVVCNVLKSYITVKSDCTNVDKNDSMNDTQPADGGDVVSHVITSIETSVPADVEQRSDSIDGVSEEDFYESDKV